MRMIMLALPALLAACSAAEEAPQGAARTLACIAPSDDPVKLAGGAFTMGSSAVYAEEGPPRKTTVAAFWIDRHEVTNRQFAAFVAATGYVTQAQKPVDPALFAVPAERIPPELLLPGSAVFTAPATRSRNYADWWRYVPGANWQKPAGPDGADAVPGEPVVHLAWADMLAYAAWRGGRMPTEAEWEFAATAGAGDYTEQPGPDAANSWQGLFPVHDAASDGFDRIAPAGCYAPNGFGLYDMIGNVWEVTQDFYRPGHDPAAHSNPRGPAEAAAFDPANPDFPSRVMKGGSYLCAPNYCRRYRPEARQGRDTGMGASNVGFRLAYDRMPDADTAR